MGVYTNPAVDGDEFEMIGTAIPAQSWLDSKTDDYWRQEHSDLSTTDALRSLCTCHQYGESALCFDSPHMQQYLGEAYPGLDIDLDTIDVDNDVAQPNEKDDTARLVIYAG